MIMRALFVAMLTLVSAGLLPAGTVVFNGVPVETSDFALTEIPRTEIPIIQIAGVWFQQSVGGLVKIPTITVGDMALPGFPLGTRFVPLTVIRGVSIHTQAESVTRWLTFYAALETPPMYGRNHFSALASAIRRQAAKEGVSDAVLTACAAFAAELKQQTKTK